MIIEVVSNQYDWGVITLKNFGHKDKEGGENKMETQRGMEKCSFTDPRKNKSYKPLDLGQLASRAY